MKHLFYLPAFLALTAVSAYAQDSAVETETDPSLSTESQSSTELSQGGDGQSSASHDFASVDKDADGSLSVEEAQEALPDLIIVDINNDGVLNRSEAQNAMPGLTFEEGEDAASTEDAPVGEQEYMAIVTAMEEQADTASVTPPASDEEV